MDNAIASANPPCAEPAQRLHRLVVSVLVVAATAGAACALAADAEALRLNPMTPYERSTKQQELNDLQQQNARRDRQQQQDQQYQDALQQSQA